MNKDLHYTAPEQMVLYKAAPELLKACKHALKFVLIDFGEMGHKVVNESGKIYQLLDEAIAKAEGKG